MESRTHRTEVIGQVYPWDLADGPARATVIRDAGVDSVAIAAAYHAVHAVRWTDDLQPAVVIEPRSASYLPVRSEAGWGRLRPSTPVASPSGQFAVAASAARKAGLGVTAWLVLAHDDEALAVDNPDLAVVDAWGTRSRSALCATQPEVIQYGRRLVEHTVRSTGVTRFLIESLTSPGFAHSHAHDKVAFSDLTPTDVLLLSLCCCGVCARDLAEDGGDPYELAHRIRRAFGGGPLGEVTLGVISHALDRRAKRVANLAPLLTAPVDGVEIKVTIAATSDRFAFGAFAPVLPSAVEGIAPCADLASPDGMSSLSEWRLQGARRTAGTLPVNSPGKSLAQLLKPTALKQLDELYLYHLGMRRPDTIAQLDIHQGEQ